MLRVKPPALGAQCPRTSFGQHWRTHKKHPQTSGAAAAGSLQTQLRIYPITHRLHLEGAPFNCPPSLKHLSKQTGAGFPQHEHTYCGWTTVCRDGLNPIDTKPPLPSGASLWILRHPMTCGSVGSQTLFNPFRDLLDWPILLALGGFPLRAFYHSDQSLPSTPAAFLIVYLHGSG